MPKFYGDSGRFLAGREFKYFFAALLFALVPLGAVIFLYTSGQRTAGFFSALAALLFVVMGGFGIFGSLQIRSMRFYRGRNGERKVRKILKALPADFSVFENLFLDPRKGNLDFVAAWPYGVAVLEVKSFGGRIDFDGQRLLINGRPLRGKNILSQARGQALALKRYLESRAGGRVFVSPALVFSHEHAFILPAARRAGGVALIRKDKLIDWIYSFSTRENSRYESVKAALMEIV